VLDADRDAVCVAVDAVSDTSVSVAERVAVALTSVSVPDLDAVCVAVVAVAERDSVALRETVCVAVLSV